MLTGVSGSFLLLSGLWQWTHATGWPTVFMLLGAVILFLVSAWDFLAYKRSQLSKAPDKELARAAGAHELTENFQRHIPPTSVTDQTTRPLNSAGKHSTDER
jgi:hypothetical protein